MANIIGSPISWNQEDAAKYFLQPLFISNNDLEYFDVMTNISGASIVLDKYAAMKDVTKSINAGCFAEETNVAANSHVTLTLTRLEVEHKQQAHALFNHIKSQFMRQGIERNDLTGTLLMQIVSELLIGGIMRDFSTILWFGDSSLGAGTQALSNGVWKAISGIPAGQKVVNGASALDTLKDMMAARTNELAGADQVMFVSRAFADQYRGELQATVVGAAYQDLQNGIENLAYNGIKMIVHPEFDTNIAAYGATLSAGAPDDVAATKCAILIARGALAVGTDWLAQDVDMWYNRDCKENRFRMNYSFGCALKDDSLVVSMAN